MKNKKIFIAGHNGMVGSSIIRKLLLKGFDKENLITASKSELNLTSQSETEKFFKENKIDEIYLAAAKVGGIFSNNTYPAQFIYENLLIQANLIHSAFLHDIKKLLFLGSSCIYPSKAEQPLREETLLTGELEKTNEPYAIAKIAGLKLCESYNRQYGKSHGLDYRCVMPTNLYGPGDNYDANNSHVIPGLIYKFHKAKINNDKEVIAWGTGNPKREFMHADDLAEACIAVHNMDIVSYKALVKPQSNFINVGSGEEISIFDLAYMIRDITGFEGDITFDKSKPDGTLLKKLDSSKINSTGWSCKIKLRDGLLSTYKSFLKDTVL